MKVSPCRQSASLLLATGFTAQPASPGLGAGACRAGASSLPGVDCPAR
jgi:hypothetical protein